MCPCLQVLRAAAGAADSRQSSATAEPEDQQKQQAAAEEAAGGSTGGAAQQQQQQQQQPEPDAAAAGAAAQGGVHTGIWFTLYGPGQKPVLGPDGQPQKMELLNEPVPEVGWAGCVGWDRMCSLGVVKVG